MSYKIEEICQINSDSLSKKDNYSYINYLDTGNLTQGIIDEIKRLDVNNEKIPSRAKRKVKKGDILISTVRPNQKHYGMVDGKIDNLIVSTGFAVISPGEKVDATYLYKYLTLPEIEEYLQSIAETSVTAYPSITPSVIGNLEIELPPLEEQKAIANILSSLDEKIELNNQMNKTLEEMAQALFKRWFVDFEFPNEEGEPYKSSGGEMVDSELGMIPKGWKVSELGELGKIVTGKTPSTKEQDNFGDEYNFITPRDIKGDIFILDTERKLSIIGASKISKNRIQPYSIGVSCIGSDLGEVFLVSDDAFTNQQINVLELDDEQMYPYMYIYLKRMKKDFMYIAGGSAVPIINKSDFSNIAIIMPKEDVIGLYDNAMSSIFEHIKDNLKMNINLKNTRDTLLPKLMSGEIRVKDLQI